MIRSPVPAPPRAAHPVRRRRPGRAAWWLIPVLLLHLGALWGLWHALRMATPPSMPAVLYTRVLLPQASPAPPPALESRAPRAPPAVVRAGSTTTLLAQDSRVPPPARRPDIASTRAPAAASTPHPAAAPPAPATASAPRAPWKPAPKAAPTLASRPAVAATPPPAAAASAPPPADAWPVSTRLEFALSGYFRGPLHGNGVLEWQRDGGHYALRLAGSALIDFSYTSRGDIDGAWLAPREYVEQVLMRRKSVQFDRNAGVLRFSAISSTMPIPAHLQDSASVFMQLAQTLRTHPQAFQRGAHLLLQVARPSGTTTWDFTVAGREAVETGAGRLDCWHLLYDPPPHADLGAQVWLAPTLQGLPVQIRLGHGDDEYLLFTLRRALQQAPAPGASAPR